MSGFVEISKVEQIQGRMVKQPKYTTSSARIDKRTNGTEKTGKNGGINFC